MINPNFQNLKFRVRMLLIVGAVPIVHQQRNGPRGLKMLMSAKTTNLVGLFICARRLA